VCEGERHVWYERGGARSKQRCRVKGLDELPTALHWDEYGS